MPVSKELRAARQHPATWENLCAKGRRVVDAQVFRKLVGGMSSEEGKLAAVAVFSHLGLVLLEAQKLAFLPNLDTPTSKLAQNIFPPCVSFNASSIYFSNSLS